MIYVFGMSNFSVQLVGLLWMILSAAFYVWLLYRFWVATKAVEETSKTVEDTYSHVRLLVDIVARGNNESMQAQQALTEELKAIRAALSVAPASAPPGS